ncbi:MAG: hypothetical protein K6E96_02205 [Bacteroidales bacterium]|nr:hypothetical protein [Bacteroidales bacterium]
MYSGTDLYYHDVFGRGNASDDFWQDYNTVPLEARIADKLRVALEGKTTQQTPLNLPFSTS